MIDLTSLLHLLSFFVSAHRIDTDTKHYVGPHLFPSVRSYTNPLPSPLFRSQWDLTRAIYRFVPRRVDTSFGAHTVDERTLLRTHLETVEWYHELVLFADAIENDDGF